MVKPFISLSLCIAVLVGLHPSQARACPLPQEAYKAPKDAKQVSLKVTMPDGETANVNSKTDSLITLTHKGTGESFTFKVNTKGRQLSIELFDIPKDTGTLQVSEVLVSERQHQDSIDAPGIVLVGSSMTFHILSMDNPGPQNKKDEPSTQGKCCIDCGSYEVCCCCCSACGYSCQPV